MQKCKSKPNSGKCNMKTKCKGMLWPFKLKWSKTVKFEADLSVKLQQQNNQFQMAMMQQSQLFQAELFKKLFDNKDS